MEVAHCMGRIEERNSWTQLQEVGFVDLLMDWMILKGQVYLSFLDCLLLRVTCYLSFLDSSSPRILCWSPGRGWLRESLSSFHQCHCHSAVHHTVDLNPLYAGRAGRVEEEGSADICNKLFTWNEASCPPLLPLVLKLESALGSSRVVVKTLFATPSQHPTRVSDSIGQMETDN